MTEDKDTEDKDIPALIKGVTDALRKIKQESKEQSVSISEEKDTRNPSQIAYEAMNKLLKDWEPWHVDAIGRYGQSQKPVDFFKWWQQRVGFEEPDDNGHRGFMKWEGDEVKTVHADSPEQFLTYLLEEIYQGPDADVSKSL